MGAGHIGAEVPVVTCEVSVQGGSGEEEGWERCSEHLRAYAADMLSVRTRARGTCRL